MAKKKAAFTWTVSSTSGFGGLDAPVEEFHGKMSASLEQGRDKYGRAFSDLLQVWGERGALWAVNEKLIRYLHKNDPQDLVKAAAWLYLLWASRQDATSAMPKAGKA